MSRIDFYHLQQQTLIDVLPKLLQKVLSSEKRAFIKVVNEENVDKLNTQLWTYAEDSFLPHGSKKDGFASQQPIWLDCTDNNANQAQYLFLVEGAEAENVILQHYERIFNIFDGKDDTSLQKARELWKKYKNAGNEVYYWQQSSNGKWEQKA